MSAARPLILIPHPDDEVVGCAVAALRAKAAGAEISGIYLTTGVPARERVWPWRRSRYGALVAGFVAFMLTRRSIFAGVVAGEIAMLAGKWWLG